MPTVNLEKNKNKLPKAQDVFIAPKRGYVVVQNPEYVRAVATGNLEAMRTYAPRFNAKHETSQDND